MDTTEEIQRIQLLLITASYRGRLEEVEALLRKGASINWRNEKGSTALHMAVAGDHIDVVQFLVERGASFIPDGKGRMPTTIAALCEVSGELCDFIVEAEMTSEELGPSKYSAA